MKNFTLKMISLALCSAWGHAQAEAENWMTNLRDDVYVQQLSIPGTHDSGTGEGFVSSFFDGFARTQDLSLQEQWDSGIRAFDLRPTAVQTASGERYLKIFHGIVETKIRFDEALRQICGQVTENPGEFAIVIMRHETDGEKSGVGNLWEVLMDSCLNAEEFSDKLIDFRNDLTVGDMRGKVLVLSRDSYLDNKRLVGGFLTNWSHSANITDQKKTRANGKGAYAAKIPFYVQDFYDCTSGKLETKLATLQTMFEEAAKALSRNNKLRTWAVNHTSGYTRSASVTGNRENAVSTHKTALDYLSACEPGSPTGIVMMDFAGVDKSGDYDVQSLALTQALIANNKPYEADPTAIAETAGEPTVAVQGGYVCASSPIAVYDLQGRRLTETGRRVQLPQGERIFVVRSTSGFSRTMTR